MEHKYDSIRELDEEVAGWTRLPEMSIENYMVPQPFEEAIVPKMEHIRNIMVSPVNRSRRMRAANRSNRIMVKNIRTGVSFEFLTMIDAARYLGATLANVRYGIGDEVARVYRVGEEEYVFVYDGKERPMESHSGCPSLNGLVEVVSSTGRRRQFHSYLSVARQLGLLVGHILEEEKRWRNNQFAKRYVTGKEEYTIEFKGERRDKDCSNGIHCHWKGVYDGDWDKIPRIKVTY